MSETVGLFTISQPIHRRFQWGDGVVAPLLIGLAGGLGVLVLAHEARSVGEVSRVDYVGAALCAVGLVGLVFGCAQETDAGWLSRVVMLPVGVGVLSLIAFSWWERRTRHPLLAIRLFKNRTLVIAIIVVIAISLSVSGSFLPLFYFLQTGQHLNPVGEVVRRLPLVLTAAVLAPVVGMAATRLGHRRTIVAGLLVAAAGSAVLAVALHPHTAYPVLLVSLLLLGAGNIAVIGPAQDLLLGSVPPERQGGAAALGRAAIQIGGALGIPSMVSALLATARPVFYAQMRQATGLTDPEIRNAQSGKTERIRAVLLCFSRICRDGRVPVRWANIPTPLPCRLSDLHQAVINPRPTGPASPGPWCQTPPDVSRPQGAGAGTTSRLGHKAARAGASSGDGASDLWLSAFRLAPITKMAQNGRQIPLEAITKPIGHTPWEIPSPAHVRCV